MANKGHTKGKEWTELQKARAEIKTLKKQLSRERKLRKKLENEQAIASLLELVEIQRREDKGLHEEIENIDLKEKWKCFDCEDGIMKLQIFHRMDGAFYYRRCGVCSNRTRMKKHHEGIEGVVD